MPQLDGAHAARTLEAAAEQRPLPWRRPRMLPWLAWVVFTPAWTASLLTTQPVTVGQRALSVGLLFVCAKCLHVGAYATWAVLSGWLQLARPYRWWLLGFLSAHGFATEYLQQFVPGRHPSWRDVGLDHLGLLIGVACTWKWWLEPRRR